MAEKEAGQAAAGPRVGLEHVDSALERVQRDLDDIRATVAQLRAEAGDATAEPGPGAEPCVKGMPGIPCPQIPSKVGCPEGASTNTPASSHSRPGDPGHPNAAPGTSSRQPSPSLCQQLL